MVHKDRETEGTDSFGRDIAQYKFQKARLHAQILSHCVFRHVAAKNSILIYYYIT